ncbi:MAG: hypothetical protein Q8P67_27900, partial [archaeon]|nr:hypothetical protein [archaeon]
MLFLFALAQGFFYSHVKLALSYRLNHPGVVYCFLCASAFFSLLQHGSDLIWDQGPGLFALLPFLTLFSSGLTLVLDWVRLSGEVADKEHAVDSVLAAYSDAQTFLNTLVYGICFTAVALAAGEWLSGIFFANVFTTVVLGFCSYHTIHLYGRSRTMKHQFSTDSFRFRHISLLLLLTIVVLLLMSMVSALSIRFRLPLPAYHLLVSSFQLVYFFLTVSVVSYANSLKFDLPDDPKELDTAFLDSVLKARGTLAPANTLVKAVRFPLVEGCHFRVSRFSLQYADPNTAGSQKAPHAVVVKILAWAKPLHERLLLNLSNSITRADPSERNAMYLKSYQVEARFYRNYAKHARGFRIPRVYLNLDDSVRCKFGLIMQEVFISSDGVASGFNFQESRFVLKKLARYHGTNWEHPKMDKMNVWRQAGYWAGAKRRNDKRAVAANWGATLQLFGALIDLPSDMLSIGSRLEPFIDQILELLEHSTPRTLLHGDFKVSNIFISSKSKQAPHHPPKDPSISCASCTSLDSPPSIGPQPADDDDDD